MEDGIERNFTFFSKSIGPTYVYVHIKNNVNKIIIEDKKEAIEYSKKNKCKLDVLYDKGNGIYRRSCEYLNFE